MDLNLYLGLPRSPRPHRLDLGSDLALSSPPLPSSTSTNLGDTRVPIASPGNMELSDSHIPYSPSHAEYTTDLPSMLSADGVAATTEYNPYNPSFEPYESSSSLSIPPLIHEPRGPNAPYSPSTVQPLPTIQEMDEATTAEVASNVQYDPLSPPVDVTEPMGYSSSFLSGLTTPLENEGATFRLYPSDTNPTVEISRQNGGSSSRFWTSDSRLRRLIEARYRWPRRGLRSSLFCSSGRFNFSSPILPNSEQVMHGTLSSERSSDCHGKHKVTPESTAPDAAEESDDRSKNAANFECNICLDMAIEPVVTSCGHLFCWPCLYQWLHLYSDHKECPVCKGQVTEANMTPIYGRGGTKSSAENTTGVGEESDPKMPLRPGGKRLESFRQQFQPMSRRLGEGIASWRRLLDQHMRSGRRYEQHADPDFHEVLEGVRRRITRLRARRLQREENPEIGSVSGELGLPATTMPNPDNATSTFRNEIDILHRLSLYSLGRERLAALTADLGRVVRRFASCSNGHGASTSSFDTPNPEPPTIEPHVAALAADQASASSTMAVIQGDISAPDAPVEPNSFGSFRTDRRSGSSSASSTFDVDGGTLNICKRRRLN